MTDYSGRSGGDGYRVEWWWRHSEFSVPSGTGPVLEFVGQFDNEKRWITCISVPLSYMIVHKGSTATNDCAPPSWHEIEGNWFPDSITGYHLPDTSLPTSSPILVHTSPILHDLTFRCSIQLPPPARPPRGPGRWQRRLRQQQSRRAAPRWRPSSLSTPSTSTPWYGTLSSVPCFYPLGHLVFAAMYSLL
jgi:hypothetical protein